MQLSKPAFGLIQLQDEPLRCFFVDNRVGFEIEDLGVQLLHLLAQDSRKPCNFLFVHFEEEELERLFEVPLHKLALLGLIEDGAVDLELRLGAKGHLEMLAEEQESSQFHDTLLLFNLIESSLLER